MVAPDLFVCETVTADQLADSACGLPFLPYKSRMRAKLLGSPTSMHWRWSERRDAACKPRVQVFQEHVVAVVGSHKTFDRQPHPMCKQTSCDIAEVSTGDGYYQLVRFAYFIQLRIRVEVVERLRKETCHIDGVG